MKRKKLPIIMYKKESRSKTILLVTVSFALIASMLFQVHLLNEISYLWGELDETYGLLLDIMEHLQSADFVTKPYI